MAALEKIRSKAVFLTVIIGLALLAFIMGDALTSGRTLFGSGNTIAKVGDVKIDVMDFQQRNQRESERMQSSDRHIDGAYLQQQTLEQMVQEVLLNKEFDALSIEVSDKELTEYMTGDRALPAVAQMAAQFQMTPAQLYQAINNPTTIGATAEQVAPLKAQWAEIQNDVIEQIKAQKLQILIAGAIQANKLDKKAIFDDNATTKTIAFVKQPYTTLKDEDFKVSDEEIKAEYNKNKSIYKLEEETRLIHYISVDVKPSTKDLENARLIFNVAVDSLKTAPGVDMIRSNTELVITESKVRATDVRNTEDQAFVKAANVGDVSNPRFENNTHSVLKLIGKELAVDSLEVATVAVQGPKNTQDSVFALLKGGKTVAELNMKNVEEQPAQWMVILNYADSIKDKLLAAPVGEYVNFQSAAEAAIFVKVSNKKAPKNVYNVASVSYQVYPSTETTDGLNDKLQAYITENNVAKTFAENAVKAGYNVLTASITGSTAQINGIESSREAIKWAFDSKTGKVSPIFKENKDVLLAVALDEIYNDYVPFNDPQVKSMISTKVRNDKKGEKLVADLQGKAKDLKGYADIMKSQVDTTQVTFGQPYIMKVGQSEGLFAATVSQAKDGELSAPVKGNNAVFVFQVSKSETTDRKLDENQTAAQFARERGSQMVMRNAINILRAATKVEKSTIKFF